MTQIGQQPYEGWAIVEQMGHVKLAGEVREVDQYGVKMLAIDVPTITEERDGKTVVLVQGFTTFAAGASLFRVTPTTEAAARDVVRWELLKVRPFIAPQRNMLAPVSDGDDDIYPTY